MPINLLRFAETGTLHALSRGDPHSASDIMPSEPPSPSIRMTLRNRECPVFSIAAARPSASSRRFCRARGTREVLS